MKHFFGLCSWVLLLASAPACKPSTNSQLQDYAIGKTEYVAEIVNGHTYLHYDADNTHGAAADMDPAVLRARYIQEFRDIMLGPEKIDGNRNYRQEWYIAELHQAAIDQLKYSITGLSKSELGAAFSKLEISSFSIPDEQNLTKIPFVEDPEKWIKVTFSARLPIQAPAKKSVSSPPRSWVPVFVHPEMPKHIYENYGPCVTYDGDDPAFYETSLFYYFDATKCDMEALNRRHQLLKPMELRLNRVAASSDGGRPEYEHIWADEKLVATFVFGVNEEFSTKTKSDAGTVAYHSFLNALSGIREMKRERILTSSARQYRAIYQITSGLNRRSKIDIQAIHVENIGDISEEQAQALFVNDRLGKHDLFVYNGHSGYGHNIEHVQKLLKPASNEYVLFFLNGCYTYSYNNLKDDNLDVLSNMKPARFSDLARASITVLRELVRQSDYKTILGRLPSFQSAIVSGENRRCPQ